jgi:pyruvate dehydrogenase E1 component alpha subunit
MPKKIIHNFQVSFLQILDEVGNCDDAQMPPLSEKELLDFYTWMVLIRAFDEKALNLQREGRLGTYASVRGQEAVQVGSGLALNETDWFFPAFREPGISMVRGLPMKMIYQYWSGDERGSEIPESINDFPISIPVGTHIPHAVGAAWGAKQRKDPVAVLVSFGDGATSKGDFHEGLNFAGVFQLPVVFLCQNNQWAISVPRSRQTASATLAQKAIAYGFDGIQVDGNDVFAVYQSVSEGLGRARSGRGPVLIECLTYRMGDHTTADDASRYRSPEEVKRWERRDPLARLRNYLERKSLWGSAMEEKVLQEAQEKVSMAVREFEATPPVDPLDFFRFVYAKPTANLLAQMERFQQELERKSKGT